MVLRLQNRDYMRVASRLESLSCTLKLVVTEGRLSRHSSPEWSMRGYRHPASATPCRRYYCRAVGIKPGICKDPLETGL